MAENRIILSAINYIEENLDGELNLDKVAKKVGYSKFHLNRLFSDYVGCTLYKYIQNRRLTEAAKKLVCSEKPIIEIALEANYGSQQAFTLAFRQLYFITPQKYRAIGIHTPKLNRFILKTALLYNYNPKCEVMAA